MGFVDLLYQELGRREVAGLGSVLCSVEADIFAIRFALPSKSQLLTADPASGPW